MQTKKLFYFFKRAKDLGFFNTTLRINHRIDKKIFYFRYKRKALLKKSFCKKNFDLDIFLKDSFVDKIRKLPEFEKNLKKNIFTKKTTVDWKFGYPDLFYQDIKIKSKNIDIKTPWELSRFQDFIHDEKSFHSKVDDWINKNNFMIGVNWVCPMEVSIRAINWLYGFSIHKNSKNIPKQFWQKILRSLHEHMFYLKNNFETSDRPNNHYISDLIGYFYLCNFFKNSKEIKKTYKKIIKQFDHQVHNDGTSYEGSTAYHKLVTELFWHFSLVCKTQKIELPKNFEIKLEKMFTFFYQTCDLKIGDDDSGKILVGIPRYTTYGTSALRWHSGRTALKTSPFSHYPDFGLTIIKNKNFKLTFRHPTYKKHQPTGHFHKDELSITLNYKDFPILVDPGSYLYTSDPRARNLFRSYQSHNTFYTNDEKEIDPLIDLFQLSKKEQSDTAKIFENEKIISVQNFYKNRKRKVIVDKNCEKIKIEDSVCKSGTYESTLIFHPKIILIKIDDYNWIIKSPLGELKLSTNILFKKEKALYSPKYGIVQNCNRLVGRIKLQPLSTNLHQVAIFVPLGAP